MAVTSNKRTEIGTLAAGLLIALHCFSGGTSAPVVAGDFGVSIDDSTGNAASDSTSFNAAGEAENGAARQLSDDDELNQLAVNNRLKPEIANGRFVLPPLVVETTATDEIGNGRTPESFRDEQPVVLTPLPESAGERLPSWNWSIAEWSAPNTFFYPLYFEDRMLERHGHVRYGCFQPAASAVRFVGSAVMLPYLATIDQPCDCDYTLGYYRSGSCAPPLLQRPPYERRAALAEAVWLGGALAIFP